MNLLVAVIKIGGASVLFHYGYHASSLTIKGALIGLAIAVLIVGELIQYKMREN